MRRKWFRLDNAALIFPAVMKRKWNNVFRLSVTLKEPIDPDCLDRAVEALRPRFPSFFVRLRTGVFWYYLEEIDHPVHVREDFAYPLTHMSKKEVRACCLRVLYYENRIAVEFFHSVTDGGGGLVFLENLTACYLTLKYGAEFPVETPLLDLSQPPRPEELQDCFLECCGKYALSRREEDAYRLRGCPTPDRFLHLTTGILPTETLLAVAHRYGVTAGVFLSAVMAEAVCEIQAAKKPFRRWRPVKITIPVDLRKLFGTTTLRNFALVANIGLDPRTGEHSLEQLCSQMAHQLAVEVTPQRMASKIAANVNPQRCLLIQVMPLFIKNFVMRRVYASTGERKGCLNISNLGPVRLPQAMEPYIERFEFIIGVQYIYPNNCSVVSFGGKTVVSMIRSTEDSDLERRFFSKLVELGIPVEIESNKRK